MIFVEAVELGSFSAAGRRLGMSPSAVSKAIARIEDRLGTRLMIRSTRALQLTAEGEVYAERARRVLGEIEEAERVVAAGARAAPRGRLRVSASVGFGERCVVPLVPEFLALHPRVELDLSLTDTVIDLIDQRTDVALRAGALRDSTLKARKILESPRVIVAAPGYLARHGTPEVPQALEGHNCLTFNFRRSLDGWPFRDPATGEAWTREVFGNVLLDNGVTMRQLCLAGLGIARIARFHVEPDIRAGLLVPLLEPFNPQDRESVHALYVGHEHLAARIRAFVDFLALRVGHGAVAG